MLRLHKTSTLWWLLTVPTHQYFTQTNTCIAKSILCDDKQISSVYIHITKPQQKYHHHCHQQQQNKYTSSSHSSDSAPFLLTAETRSLHQQWSEHWMARNPWIHIGCPSLMQEDVRGCRDGLLLNPVNDAHNLTTVLWEVGMQGLLVAWGSVHVSNIQQACRDVQREAEEKKLRENPTEHKLNWWACYEICILLKPITWSSIRRLILKASHWWSQMN